MRFQGRASSRPNWPRMITGGRYWRLKLSMLVLVVMGSAAAGSALFSLLWAAGGVFQGPFRRLFIWIVTSLFGQSHEEAAALYQAELVGRRYELLLMGMILLMLLAFYLVMGRFTRWLDRIAFATRQVVAQSGEEIRLPRELEPLEQDLNRIRVQLREREAAARQNEERRRDLVAFLAHDLKTPLTSVVGYLTLLRDGRGMTGEQRAKYTGVALDKARRLEELLGEFFDITCMDLQMLPEKRTRIQLSLLLEQVADEFYPLFSEKQLSCTPEIESGLVVEGDPDLLARVFDNVLRNAVSYSTPGGEVGLRAWGGGDTVEVVIRNEGLEIPEGELSHIFQKFYRLDAARSTRTGGAGLGLAIAKEIVTLHSGSIRAESNGRLTSFLITLPAAPA